MPSSPVAMVGAALYDIRIRAGLTQGKVEKRSGLKRCYLSRIENGRHVVSMETLYVWAAALGVSGSFVLMYAEKLAEEGYVKPTWGDVERARVYFREV